MQQWGAIAISVLAMAVFIACLVVALRLQDHNMLLMLVGAAIAMAQTAVGFWLGSSSSSQRKDETIAKASNVP